MFANTLVWNFYSMGQMHLEIWIFFMSKSIKICNNQMYTFNTGKLVGLVFSLRILNLLLCSLSECMYIHMCLCMFHSSSWRDFSASSSDFSLSSSRVIRPSAFLSWFLNMSAMTLSASWAGFRRPFPSDTCCLMNCENCRETW